MSTPLVEVLFKYLARYFIPGVFFVFFVIYLPAFLATNGNLPQRIDLFESIPGVILSGLVGFVLESLGSYSWLPPPLWRRYRKMRKGLAQEAGKTTGIASDDPDQHLAVVWLNATSHYDSINVERAEWVMVLQLSFATMISSTVILAMGLDSWLVQGGSSWWYLVSLLVVAGISLASGNKGLQRMEASNKKILAAIAAPLPKKADEVLKRTGVAEEPNHDAVVVASSEQQRPQLVSGSRQEGDRPYLQGLLDWVGKRKGKQGNGVHRTSGVHPGSSEPRNES